MHSKILKRMTQEECKTWIKALRSSEYRQARRALKRGNQHYCGYCCLGVAEIVCDAPRYDGFSLCNLYLPEHIQSKLINLNDVDRLSFTEIADYIEEKVLPKLPE